MLCICFIVLLVIPNLHGLICYSNRTFDFSSNDFNRNHFLTNINTQQIVSSPSCHVRITVDYNNARNTSTTIEFGLPIDQNRTHIEFGSTVKFVNNDIQSIVSHLDYTCSSGNLCDKIFIDKWTKKLLHTSDNSLHNSFIPLWANSGPLSNKCHTKQVTDVCESYLCFMIYDELKNLSYGKSQCEDQSSSSAVLIHVRTYAGNRMNDYQCMKNLCTKELVYNSILEKNSAKKSIDRTNELIIKRALLIVGVLLIIGSIAYYIRCRNYRQGYRLTRRTA